MELVDVAGRVEQLAGDVTQAASRLAQADPGARAFAADGTGALHAIGRTLHAQWVSALAAREREAAAVGRVAPVQQQYLQTLLANGEDHQVDRDADPRMCTPVIRHGAQSTCCHIDRNTLSKLLSI